MFGQKVACPGDGLWYIWQWAFRPLLITYSRFSRANYAKIYEFWAAYSSKARRPYFPPQYGFGH